VSTVRWLVAGLAVLYLLVGAWLVRRVAQSRAELRASESWAPTRGRVVSSELQDLGKSGLLPRVAYEYEAGGGRYRSERIHHGDPHVYSFASTAQRAIAPYAIGAEVSVWFDPADPGRAVLERRAPVLVRDLVLLGLVTAVLVGLAAGLEWIERSVTPA
jgi:hypothetical protein